MPTRTNVTALLCCFIFIAAPSLHSQTVTVDIAPTSASNRFIPDQTLGSSLDRISVEAIDKALTKPVLDAVAPSGWQPITYRQNTELEVEAWHWNPVGSWSGDNRGYFTGSATPTQMLRYTYGYSLPRRGFTRNDGTGNTGYSRLTDGDTSTFWKSDPYLTRHFTGEDDSLHPQWVILDLKSKQLADSIRIAWAAPYATHYQIQYWTGLDPILHPTLGVWETLPRGEVTNGKGGTETIRFSDHPMLVQYIRIRMTESSNTCDADGSSDIRNCVGYAIREIYFGTTTPDGAFHDSVRHTPDQDQTTTYCSSVDSWHTAADLINKRQAQVGFDLFYTSGITHNLPAMIPIAMIYNQPEDAVNELKYIQARHYPISYVEMGEESDGQYISPEDYGALYIQFATAIHRFDPSLKLGGPSFQGVNDDIRVWPDASGNTSWLNRFLNYLRAHNAIQQLAFFSFEHYPLPPCRFSWSALYEEPKLVSHIMDVWKQDGLPENIPIFITESNLSAGASEAYMDNFAGLWLADYIGSFLTSGGNGVYYFHYLPLKIYHGCANSPGTFGMFLVDGDYNLVQPLAQFYASKLINTEWVQPGSATNTIFPATSTYPDGAGNQMVTAYAVHRPDHQWAVMLVNRDQQTAHTIHIAFTDSAAGKSLAFNGSVETFTYGAEQYQWHPLEISSMAHPEHLSQSVIDVGTGRANPDNPPVHKQVEASSSTEFEIPAASILIVRGEIGPQ